MQEYALNNLLLTQELDTSISSYLPAMDSLIDNIIVYNDSVVLKTTAYQQQFSAAAVPIPGYLVLDSIKYQYNNQPDSAGIATFYFKNYGNQSISNLSGKIIPDTLFHLTSTDSLYLGTLSPGETKTMAYQFIAPAFDTSVYFTVHIKADNGIYSDAVGNIYVETKPFDVTTIANGLWSNPATWSNNKVPNKYAMVTIKHTVDVDIVDAVCYSLKAILPGLLRVLNNKHLKLVNN
jgi:hypothetical protein